MWGASFLFIRVAVPALGPASLVDIRVVLAAGALLLYGLLTGYHFSLRGHIWALLMLGAINAAIPFSLIAFAELSLPASLAAILNATTPLFTAIVAAVWLGDPFTWKKSVGLALGVVGVGVTVGLSPLHLTTVVALAIGASLLAAFFYGLGGVYARVRFSDIPAMTLAFGQQLGAGVILLPLAIVRPPLYAPSPHAVASLLALALLSTSVGYLLYFFLMASVGPTSTLSVTFLVPIFGGIWSVLFLGEHIGPGLIGGLAIILLSVGLVTDMQPGRLVAALRAA
jgi:drug/metabolite transporter (DMT)-like permease